MQTWKAWPQCIAELQRYHADLTFRVVGTAALVTVSGQHGEMDGMPFTFEQTAHVQGTTLNADIRIELLQGDSPATRRQVGELEVRTTLQRGEFVVLGENTHQGAGIDGTLFYIVHWPEAQ